MGLFHQFICKCNTFIQLKSILAFHSSRAFKVVTVIVCVCCDCGFEYFNQRAFESASLLADCAASMLKMAALQTLSLNDLILTPVAITGASLAPWVRP